MQDCKGAMVVNLTLENAKHFNNEATNLEIIFSLRYTFKIVNCVTATVISIFQNYIFLGATSHLKKICKKYLKDIQKIFKRHSKDI